MKPLLVIDGDSFAHRAYHALPKSIRAEGGGRSSASPTCLLGSGRRSSRARCSSAGTRSASPTYRHEAFEATRAAACSTTSLLEQLDLLPELVGALGFAAAKGARLRGGRLPRRGGRLRGGARRRGARRDLRPRRVPARERADDDPPAGARRLASSRASGRRRCASATASSRRRCRTSSRCAATRPTSSRARAASGRRRPPTILARVRLARGRARGRAASPPRRRICGSTGESRRWTPPPRSLPSTTRPPRGRRRPLSRGAGA